MLNYESYKIIKLNILINSYKYRIDLKVCVLDKYNKKN